MKKVLAAVLIAALGLFPATQHSRAAHAHSTPVVRLGHGWGSDEVGAPCH